MAEAILLPKQGQSVETCLITQWFKKIGDKVEEGDLLFAYETDKAAFEEEAKTSGILLEIFFNEGDEVPVLTNVGVIGKKGEDTDEYSPAKETETDSIPEPAAKDTVEVGKKESLLPQAKLPGGRLKISPRAKNMAQEKNIDPSELTGSGPNGRIIVRDVITYFEKRSEKGFTETKAIDYSSYPGIVAETTDKPLSNIRRIIAGNMHKSLRNSAQLTHHISADARKIISLRKTIKQKMESERLGNITLNDMVCYAVVQSLRKFPAMNAQFLGDKIREFHNVNLGIAVDTERGLMVPVLMNADGYNLEGLAGKLKSLAEDCRKGKIDPELLKSENGSFTVSNLGAFGIEMFTPVLNLPQVGILGVNTITHRPFDLGEGTIGIVPVIGLSLTYDHRAVDGAPASAFLKEVADFICNFSHEI